MGVLAKCGPIRQPWLSAVRHFGIQMNYLIILSRTHIFAIFSGSFFYFCSIITHLNDSSCVGKPVKGKDPSQS